MRMLAKIKLTEQKDEEVFNLMARRMGLTIGQFATNAMYMYANTVGEKVKMEQERLHSLREKAAQDGQSQLSTDNATDRDASGNTESRISDTSANHSAALPNPQNS